MSENVFLQNFEQISMDIAFNKTINLISHACLYIIIECLQLDC